MMKVVSSVEQSKQKAGDDQEDIYYIEDIFSMLDAFLREPGPFWDGFFADRQKNIPFFLDVPDENLVSYFVDLKIAPSKVLELGCGNGRNAVFMAKQGCHVDAVDISEVALQWARENAERAEAKVNFTNCSVLDVAVDAGEYDFVYDAGCLHHIPPHRRINYIDLVTKAVKPQGFFGLTCFAEGGGAEISDWEVYRLRSLQGGLAYSEAKLKRLFAPAFNIVEFRKMREIVQPASTFGKSFLWAVLLQRK